MKKKILIGIGVVLLIIIGIFTYLASTTKKHSPAAVAEYTDNGLNLLVNYCRPFKKGRIIFGDKSTGALQPYGKYWRVGANEATTISTATPIIFNGAAIAPGKYALYAIPGPSNWTIALNTENDRWGATAPDEANDVLRTQVAVNVNADMQEQFLITFEPNGEQVNLVLHWENSKVSIPISKQ